MTTLLLIQNTISKLNLHNDDIIYNVFMPTQSCDKCGGFGISGWNENKSILCECLLESKEQHINYGLLNKLANITKNEVYHGEECN